MRVDLDELRPLCDRASGPHELLAESVLRLAVADRSAEVRQLGVLARGLLPDYVLQQVAWSPSTHQLFCEQARAVVRCVLMLGNRGAFDAGGTLPSEVLVLYVLPNADLRV